ncbi:type II toxin-antitoxin system RelE/ParE family toxin [Micrococcaceae bacterium RIT802]|nr:type II toxin-antitoxin system RelE/ParE family toxin [Micrococcaceae bacterium RIT 802]
MWGVDVERIEGWLDGLDRDSWEQVLAAIALLRDQGRQLGRPLVDTVTASRYKNMKQPRPGSSGRSEIRIVFAFGPERRAIMLIAGDTATRREAGRPGIEREFPLPTTSSKSTCGNWKRIDRDGLGF